MIDELGLFSERLREWENFYNFDRSHGSLGGQTPGERLRQKTGVAMWAAIVSCTPRSHNLVILSIVQA